MQTKIQKYGLFSSKNIYLWNLKCQKPNESNEDEQGLADLSSAYSRSQAKCQLIQISYFKLRWLHRVI